MILASDIGAIDHQDFQSLLEQVVDVKKMLTGLLNRLDPTKPPSAPKQTANKQ